jgi:hypothetical protein
VRSNGTDEVLARAMNLLIARGAYRERQGISAGLKPLRADIVDASDH